MVSVFSNKSGVVFFAVLFFFLATPASALDWFYTESGDVYSSSRINMGDNTARNLSTYQDYFSGMCTNTGQSGLITYASNINDEVNSGSETADTLNGGTGSGSDWVVNNLTNTKLAQYDYNYFSTLPTTVPTPPASSTLCDHGTNTVAPGIHKITTGTLTIGCTSPNEFQTQGDYIFIVNGDITINTPLKINDGDFLMFVSSGRITFHESLSGSVDNPAIQGIFIADILRTSNVGSTTTPLFAKGIFIAHNQIQLRRNTDDSIPAEYFMYNPSLLLNAPHALRTNLRTIDEIEP